MSYDPTIAGLIDRTDEDWGDPAENVAKRIDFGIPPIDKALFGMDCINGELLGIQANEKERKSTVLANILYNVASQKRFGVCIDTLESGMNPLAYRDVLISMVTTRTMIASVYGDDRAMWPVVHDIFAHPVLQDQLCVSKDFLWYSSRSARQQAAIEQAKKQLRGMPIVIFGPHPEEGDTKNLQASMQRWHLLYHGEHPKAKGKCVRVFGSDHLQEYAIRGDDYIRMEAVVPAFADFVTSHPGTVVIAVSQVSVTSTRLAKQGLGQKKAKGGAKLGAEVVTIFETEYDQKATPYTVTIGLSATRKRPFPTVTQEIDPSSGAFLRPGYRKLG